MRLFIVFAILGLLAVFVPRDACAQVIPGSSCSTAYMDVLKNRAWVQGKSELEMAQTLILKPDSVLEYSCFEMRRRELGRGSTGSQWIDTSPTVTMMGYLDKVVGGPLQNYMRANFSHVAAGGRYQNPSTGVCDLMYQVWDFLRCAEFEEDSFMIFTAQASNEIRTLPRSCTLMETDRGTKWNRALNIAYPSPGGRGAMAPVALRLDLFMPSNCSNVTPVPTGVMVAGNPRSGGAVGGATSYPDKICPSPGCYYVPETGSSGTGSCRPSN